MSIEPPQDVPSPIEFREMTDAREWEASAEQRPGRSEILDRITHEAAQLTRPGDRILELGSGPGFLAQRLLQRLPDVHYTALDFSPAMHELARARLEPWAARVTFLERSFKSDVWPEGLEPFRLVVTNQAVHELRHKRHALGLHRQVLGVLAPDGSYLLSDHFNDPGGLENTELYMKRDDQITALHHAGFASVDRLAVAGSLVLHLARKA
ncbi:MAG: class I SAM-dependent methyltransferase [Actinomycetota bacterium]|nr:class I SAM-dependent methyltransferase [Actinomycetota bacterium]